MRKRSMHDGQTIKQCPDIQRKTAGKKA